MATRRHKAMLLVLAAIVLGAVCALVFGPARGARDDIGRLRADQDVSRGYIHRQLETVGAQLTVAQRSLGVQRQGLVIAARSQQLVGATSRSTTDILGDTDQALSTVRQALAALQPLRQLRTAVRTTSHAVTVGLQVARGALDVARSTLQNGEQALAVARRTLATLEQSRTIQQQLLAVARRTLAEARHIDRKIPTPPVFPAAPGSGS